MEITTSITWIAMVLIATLWQISKKSIGVTNIVLLGQVVCVYIHWQRGQVLTSSKNRKSTAAPFLLFDNTTVVEQHCPFASLPFPSPLPCGIAPLPPAVASCPRSEEIMYVRTPSSITYDIIGEL
jgi:hypothetical protein